MTRVRLPSQVPPFFIGLVGIVILLAQTFIAETDRPWLLAAGLTCLGFPVFYSLSPPRQTPPPQPPPQTPVPDPSETTP